MNEDAFTDRPFNYYMMPIMIPDINPIMNVIEPTFLVLFFVRLSFC